MIKGTFIKFEDNMKLRGWANKDLKKKKNTQRVRTASQIELDNI